MNGPVHTIIGITTGIAGATALYDKLPILAESPLGPSCFILAITVGSVAPDLDLPGRPLGFLGHRRLTHTLLAPAVCTALMIFIGNSKLPVLPGMLRALLFGFTWGYVMHIIADLFQKRGVPLFWPIMRNNVHIANMPVKYDKYFLIIYVIALIAISVHFGNTTFGVLEFVKSTPAVAIAVVVAVYELKKSMKKVNKQHRRH